MFSVIIPTYNRAASLARSLPLVLAMRGAAECEILVVDDGSTDDTWEMLAALASRQSNLHPLRQERNSGPGPARNLGLERARRERLLFLDDDVWPDPGLAEAHWRRLEEGGLSQGRLVWPPELAEQEIIKFMDARGMQFRLDGCADGDRLSYLQVYTANLAVQAADLRAVGGFDAVYAGSRYGFEDTALAWKLEKTGRIIRYTSAAWAWHHHPMTEEGLLKREYNVGYSMALTKKLAPEIAADFRFDRLVQGLGWKLPAVKLMNAVGLPALFGRGFKRRLAVKEAFLTGARDGLKELEKS